MIGKTFLILWSRHFTFTKPHFSIHSSSDQQDSDNLRSILTLTLWLVTIWFWPGTEWKRAINSDSHGHGQLGSEMKSYQLALLTAAPGKVDAKAQHYNQLRKSEKLERYSGGKFQRGPGAPWCGKLALADWWLRFSFKLEPDCSLSALCCHCWHTHRGERGKQNVLCNHVSCLCNFQILKMLFWE